MSSAGTKLRRRVNATLKRAAADAGIDLELTDLETWMIDRACELDDWRERLQARQDAEQAREAGAATVVNLSGELRCTVHFCYTLTI